MVCHGIRALLIIQLPEGPSAKQVSKSLTALIAMLTVLVEGIDYGFARGKKASEPRLSASVVIVILFGCLF